MTAAIDFFSKTSTELSDDLIALKREQFNLRFQKASGQLENTVRMRQVRRDIARIKTILNMRDEAGNPLPGAKLPRPANEAKPVKAKAPKAKKADADAEVAPAADAEAKPAAKAKKPAAKKAAGKTASAKKADDSKSKSSKSKAAKAEAAAADKE